MFFYRTSSIHQYIAVQPLINHRNVSLRTSSRTCFVWHYCQRARVRPQISTQIYFEILLSICWLHPESRFNWKLKKGLLETRTQSWFVQETCLFEQLVRFAAKCWGTNSHQTSLAESLYTNRVPSPTIKYLQRDVSQDNEMAQLSKKMDEMLRLCEHRTLILNWYSSPSDGRWWRGRCVLLLLAGLSFVKLGAFSIKVLTTTRRWHVESSWMRVNSSRRDESNDRNCQTDAAEYLDYTSLSLPL